MQEGFIANLSLLKELLRGVAFFIDDPQTFRSFALTSTITYQATKEFIAYKKKQFTRYINIFTYNSTEYHIPTLPNGHVHGIIKIENKLIDIRDGKCVKELILTPDDTYVFTAIIYDWICSNNYNMLTTRMYHLYFDKLIRFFKNKTSQCRFYLYRCKACKRYHHCKTISNDNDYILLGFCHTNSLIKIIQQSKERPVISAVPKQYIKQFRRSFIAQCVINYSKTLIK